MHTNRKIQILILAFLCFLGSQRDGIAQINEDLYIYGYFQGVSRYLELESNPHTEINKTWSLSIQQMNLFLFKQFDPEFSGFVNFEITNSLSTVEGWGGIALDEAWMKYDPSRKVKLKAGLLIPTFNNLNTIKNRTPLLPYIYRPIAYETSFREYMNTDELAPRHAFLEVYGSFELGLSTKLDYAAYLGNQEAFIISEPLSTLSTGSDSTVAKLVGGRVGIRFNGVKVGVSVSHDKTDLTTLPEFAIEFQTVGVVPRQRFGVDFSVTMPIFFIESELIMVSYFLSDTKQAQLTELVSQNPLLTNEFNKIFAYGTLGVNIGDKVFAYGMYSYFKDRSNLITDNGVGMFSVGGGYRPNDNLVFKAQFLNFSTYSRTIFFWREKDFLIGLSVFL